MRRFQIFIGITALVLLGSDQALVGGPSDLSADRWDTRLRLFAVQPTLALDSTRLGTPSAAIPSFGQMGAMGEVYLPVKIVRIAIPEGTGQVSLRGIQGDPAVLHGFDLPPPSEELRPIGSPRGKFRRRGGGGAPPAPRPAEAFVPPGSPVQIGDVGYLRDQRFVEIRYTPVVSPPGGGEALFYRQVELEIVVEGVDSGTLDGVPAPRDPVFEDSYKKAFANYEQARYFRARGGKRSPGGGRALSGGSAAPTLESAAAESTITLNQTGGPFPDYKLTVTRDGIYRLTRDYLIKPGQGVALGLSGADPREFKILNRGVEIPIHVAGEGDGSFDTGDYIEFYGQALDGPETSLNYDLGALPSIYQLEDTSDENIYWLEVDASGTRVRMSSRAAPPNGAFAVQPDFLEILRAEVDNLFQPTGPEDPFLMTPRLNSNSGSIFADPNTCVYVNTGIPSQPGGDYLGPDITDPNDPDYCAVCEIEIPGINAAAPGNAVVSFRMRGTTDDLAVTPDHLTVMQVGASASDSSVLCWDGLSFVTQTVTLPHTSLVSPLQIRVEQPGLSTVSGNEQLLTDYAEVAYRRLTQAQDDGIRMSLIDLDRRIAVSGLSTNDPNQVTLLEITQTTTPVEVMGGPPGIIVPERITGGSFSGSAPNFTLTFTNDDDPNSSADRVYHLAGPGPGGFMVPDAVVEDTPSNLMDPNHEADVLVIGEASLMDMSANSPFSDYWDHRALVDGFAVEIVDVQDVIDEFGFGIHHPDALKHFLDYAYDNWKGPLLDPNRPAPAFAALVGDMTADPKNNLNRSDWVNQVPSYMMFQSSAVLGFYVSDNFIAAFRGMDQLPDINLGRISVQTPAEADIVFTKMLNYDQPPSGTWISHGTFITDEGKSLGESGEFERITSEVIDNYWQPQPPHSFTKIYYDEPVYGGGNDPALVLSDILAAIDAGTGLVTYTGHGAFSIWGVDGFLHTSDVNSLTPNGRYFFGINENCLAGGFHFLGGDALSEAFLKADDKGAIAYLAPAGLSFSFIGEFMNDQLYGDMFGPQRIRRFGELVTNVRLALGTIGAIIDQQSYTLVGDPTQKFALPAPEPPGNLAAASGNAEVNLTWSPSPDPNTETHIYRAGSPGGAYSRITSTPVAGTSFMDTTVANAQDYFYYATSITPDGYEGAISNANSDCDTMNLPSSGPDCVWALPVNPNAPSTPAGESVSGDGSGSRLVVSWLPNPEIDLDSYIVEYGTTMGGPYPSIMTASPSATSVIISGLITGNDYYLILKAKNTSGIESPPTAEMHGVPLTYSGEAPPKFITDLNIVVTPGDATSLTLSWSKPVEDIYGAPTSVASYALYRDTFAGFVPNPANLIATINDPDQTSYIDTGAAVTPDNYFYLLAAIDAQGLASGLGHDLPAGINDLYVDLINGGTTVRFDWSSVTTDISGNPSNIAKYQLFAASTPVSRAMVEVMSPLVDNITTNFVEVAENPAHIHYTVIVVDSKGNRSPY